ENRFECDRHTHPDRTIRVQSRTSPRANFNSKGLTMKALISLAAILSPLTMAAHAQPGSNSSKTIDDFFRDFADDWARHDPFLATRSRYLTGEEQDRLEREMTPWTLAWRRERVERARQGLAQLGKFDRSKMTETQRVSAAMM